MAMNPADKESLAIMINTLLAMVPGFARGAVKPQNLEQYLAMVPDNFRGYTLQELIDALSESVKNGSIKL